MLQADEEGTTSAGAAKDAKEVSEKVDEAAEMEVLKDDEDEEGGCSSGNKAESEDAGKPSDIDSLPTTAHVSEPSSPKKRALPRPVETIRATIKISSTTAAPTAASASTSGLQKATSTDPSTPAGRSTTSANDNNPTGTSEGRPQPKPPKAPSLQSPPTAPPRAPSSQPCKSSPSCSATARA
jgi:hypothetical protein